MATQTDQGKREMVEISAQELGKLRREASRATMAETLQIFAEIAARDLTRERVEWLRSSGLIPDLLRTDCSIPPDEARDLVGLALGILPYKLSDEFKLIIDTKTCLENLIRGYTGDQYDKLLAEVSFPDPAAYGIGTYYLATVTRSIKLGSYQRFLEANGLCLTSVREFMTFASAVMSGGLKNNLGLTAGTTVYLANVPFAYGAVTYCWTLQTHYVDDQESKSVLRFEPVESQQKRHGDFHYEAKTLVRFCR